MVYAGVLAHGTSMSAADIVRMVPELSSPSAIRQMMHRIADERKLRQAADAVLVFMHQHPIAQHWGRADLASSDMMSLETTRTVWRARADPRRRTASIGMYTHVRDCWGIFYDQPILLNEPQAGAAIEGVIRQSGSEEVAQLAVDTHGFTDFAMSLSRLLGFDLCPRLAHLRDRRLHVPRDHDIPAELAAVTDAGVRLILIERAWERAIHYGKIPLELTRHDASLAAVSSALTLLSNAVMAWNTLHMQRALDAIEAIGGEAMRAEDLRQIAPTHLEGINLRGTFDFPIARYAHTGCCRVR